MNLLDWIILFGTLATIVIYGTWKTRGAKNMESYLKGDNSMKWWMIGVSIMAIRPVPLHFYPHRGRRWKMACASFNFILVCRWP